jgi:hypothetical protein
MDDVEKLQQMNDVERMREVMDVISDSMHKQNDKDRLEILAMLASTTAMETNLMSVNFAQRVKTASNKTTSTKQKGKAIKNGVEQAENGKNDENKTTSSTQANKQNQNLKQQPNQLQQVPASTLATRTQQALNKKKRLAGRGTLSAVGTLGAV